MTIVQIIYLLQMPETRVAKNLLKRQISNGFINQQSSISVS